MIVTTVFAGCLHHIRSTGLAGRNSQKIFMIISCFDMNFHLYFKLVFC